MEQSDAFIGLQTASLLYCKISPKRSGQHDHPFGNLGRVYQFDNSNICCRSHVL